jgi:hypothetical protein
MPSSENLGIIVAMSLNIALSYSAADIPIVLETPGLVVEPINKFLFIALTTVGYSFNLLSNILLLKNIISLNLLV